jgi:acyl-CoA reductase-like NAD-dependent aldehyde dehydrogenase
MALRSRANVLSWRAVLSPIAAGNTVVVKPSELAPISAGVMLAQIVEEAGFPKGVINVVTHAPGAAGEIADVFFDSPAVRVTNLIGGVKTARILAERAGKTLKRTTMELGGYNPVIILDDVDSHLDQLPQRAAPVPDLKSCGPASRRSHPIPGRRQDE